MPSCGGIRVGVGGGAERTEPVNVRLTDPVFDGGVGRRGLLLLPLTTPLVVALVVEDSPSSCASADSSTFDRRVGRMNEDDDDDVACESGSGRGEVCGCGEEVVVGGEEEAAAASETCEREAVDGESAAQSESED